MGKISKVKVLFITIVLMLSTLFIVSGEIANCETRSLEDTRIYVEMEKDGGEWYDDLSDNSWISEMDRTIFEGNRIEVGDVVFSEDFEGFTNEQNIFGTNGWTRHTTNNEGTFLCDTSSPYNSVTPKVAKHHNSDTSIYSSVLSGTFLSTKGTYELWTMTSKIDPVITTTSMNLVSKTHDDPIASNRLLDVAFTKGGFGCRGSSGNWNMLSTSVSVNTWYRVSVDYDCSKNLCNVYLYNKAGTLLGSGLDVGFQFSQTSARRLMLTTAPNSQGITSYWDDIKIIDRTGTGSAISEKFDLPGGKKWSTISIDKDEPGSSWIELDILDGTGEKVKYFDYNVNASEIDITELNDLGVGSISLKVTLHGVNGVTPSLKGWGIELASTYSWHDSFRTSIMTEYLSGARIVDGNVKLVPGQLNGVYESVPLYLPENSYWDVLKVNMSSKSYSKILFDIIDCSTEKTVPGYSDIWSRDGITLNLTDIDPNEYPVIRIRARLNQEEHIEPVIHSITVRWVGNMFPDIFEFDVDPTILRTEAANISFRANDNEQTPGDLHVSVDYLEPESVKWRTDMLSDIRYNTLSTKYECEFITNTVSPVGVYFIRVTVTDELGCSRVMVYDDRLEVKNNIPSSPTLVLGPESPTTRSDITATITEPSFDLENPNMKYFFTFYINGLEDEDSKKDNVPEGAVPYLPSSKTEKGDMIGCTVKGYDGLNFTESYTASILILNTPPEPVKEYEDYVVLYEDTEDDTLLDLTEIIYDIDGDPITYTSLGSGNISVEVDESNGKVNIIPDPDFFGEENVTFVAGDGEEMTYFEIRVYVLPINDPPTGSIVSPSSDIDLTLYESVTLTATGEDLETDEEDLLYTWMIDDVIVGEGNNVTLNWTEVGVRNITCYISDGEEKTPVGSVMINVFKPAPPYTDEEVERKHEGSDPAIIFDVEDAFGNARMARYDSVPSIDLKNLTVSVDDYHMVFTLELGAAPVAVNPDDPYSSTSGEWAYYNVYFVTAGWSEEEFLQSSLKLYDTDLYHPVEEQLLKIGEQNYILSFGDGSSFGSPTIDGNNIVWRLDSRDLAAEGLLIEDMNLWGSVRYINVDEGAMIGGYDTIGHGSREHPVVAEKVKDNEAEDESSLVWIILIVILILIILGLVGALVLTMKKNSEQAPVEELSQDAEKKDEDDKETVKEGNVPPEIGVRSQHNLPEQGSAEGLPPTMSQSLPQPAIGSPQLKPAPIAKQPAYQAQTPAPAQQAAPAARPPAPATPQTQLSAPAAGPSAPVTPQATPSNPQQ